MQLTKINEIKKIQLNHKEYGLESTKAQQISDMFVPMLNKMTALESEYNNIISLPINKETSILARSLRIKYSKIRTETACIHKDLKAFYLSGGRFVDGWRNAQKMACDGIEKSLLSVEKHVENIELEKQNLLKDKRLKELQKYNYAIEIPHLGKMRDSVWDLMIKSIKTDYENKIEVEKKAIELRKEQERVEAEKRIKIQEENRLLKIKANEKQAEIDKQKAEIARIKKEEQAKQQAEIDKQKAEIARIKKEEQAKSLIEVGKRLAVINKQKAEIARIKKEEQAKQQAEIDKQQAELAKGDKEKVMDLIDDLSKVSKKFKFESEKNKKMFSDVNTLLFKVINHIEKTQRGYK